MNKLLTRLAIALALTFFVLPELTPALNLGVTVVQAADTGDNSDKDKDECKKEKKKKCKTKGNDDNSDKDKKKCKKKNGERKEKCKNKNDRNEVANSNSPLDPPTLVIPPVPETPNNPVEAMAWVNEHEEACNIEVANGPDPYGVATFTDDQGHTYTTPNFWLDRLDSETLSVPGIENWGETIYYTVTFYFPSRIEHQYDTDTGDFSNKCRIVKTPLTKLVRHKKVIAAPNWCPLQPYLRATQVDDRAYIEWRDGRTVELPLVQNIWEFETGDFSNPSIHWTNCKYATEYWDEDGNVSVRIYDFGGNLLKEYDGMKMPEFPLKESSPLLFAIREADGQLVEINIETDRIMGKGAFGINPISVVTMQGIYVALTVEENLLSVVEPTGKVNQTEQVCQRVEADHQKRLFACRTDDNIVYYNPATGKTTEIQNTWDAAAINPENSQQIALTGMNLTVLSGSELIEVSDLRSYGGSDWGGKTNEIILVLNFLPDLR